MRVVPSQIWILVFLCCAPVHEHADREAASPGRHKSGAHADLVADVLTASYPETILSCDSAVILFKNGGGIIRITKSARPDYSTLTTKDYELALGRASVDEQVLSGRTYSKSYFGSALNIDPGRMRDESFFKAMYGSTPREVKNNMSVVTWMPGVSNKKVLFSNVNSAHEKLESVSRELVRLPVKFHKYVSKISGTYNWRNIREPLKTHSCYEISRT